MPRSRRALLGGVAAATTAAVAGCSLLQHAGRQSVTSASAAAWPTRYGGSHSAAANDIAGIDGEPTRQWPDRTFPHYDSGAFTANGGGFVIDTHTLTAVNPNGSVRWRSDAGYYGPVLLADEVVVAESMNGGLVALKRSSGERAWSVSAGEALAVVAGRLLARTGPETVASLTPGGETTWSGSEYSSYSPVTAVGDGTVVAVFTERYRPQPDTDEVVERSTVVAYDAVEGGEQWRFHVPGTVLRVAVRDGDTHIGANVRADEGPLGALQYVLSLSDGRAESRYTYPGVTLDALAVGDERVFVATERTLRAFGSRLGPLEWEQTLSSAVASLAAAASSLYVTRPAEDGEATVLAALDAANGETRWQKTLPVGWAEVVGVTDGRVFVETSGTPGLYVFG